MNTLTIQRRTIKVTKLSDLPRKKKKKLKKAMRFKWHEEPINPNYIQTSKIEDDGN